MQTGQLALLIGSILLFAAAAATSIARPPSPPSPPSPPLSLSRPPGRRRGAGPRGLTALGIAAAIAVLIWHAAARTTGNWLPLEDNSEAFLWLAILLAGFVIYVQLTRPVSGLDWFVLPLVIVLVGLSAMSGKIPQREYANTIISWVHRLTSFAGALAFTIAGAAGAMYLLASRRLRQKGQLPSVPLGNLERLERLTNSSVILGFALMTIGIVAGFIWQLRVAHSGRQTVLGPNWWASPKVLLGTAVWLVYALVLHARITPVLRGRKVALLSILGCLLTVATLLALNLMPAMPAGGSR